MTEKLATDVENSLRDTLSLVLQASKCGCAARDTRSLMFEASSCVRNTLGTLCSPLPQSALLPAGTVSMGCSTHRAQSPASALAAIVGPAPSSALIPARGLGFERKDRSRGERSTWKVTYPGPPEGESQ